MFGIRTSLYADPDPGFYLNADPDADRDAVPDYVLSNLDSQASFSNSKINIH